MRTCLVARAILPIALSALSGAAAAEWPQWRGENRDGRSPETGLVSSWPADGPPKAWSAGGFGTGFSSLSVAGGRIFTLGDLPDGQHLIAAKESDGSILWKVRVGPIHEDEFPGPRSTPTVAGGRVFALGTEGDLVCVQASDGKELWRKNILSSGSQRLRWKISESPLVDGDRVIVTPGSPGALMLALDAATGKEIWATKASRSLGSKGDDGPGYSSAVISQGGGVKQYVQIIGRGAIGVEAATGKLLWNYNKVANDVANIPTPLVSGDFVFVSTGYQTGAALLQISSSGSGVTAAERYFLPHTVFQNHHGNMILDQGVIYAGHGHNRGNPIAIQMESGKVLWGPADNSGSGSAAVAWADGKLYLRYQNGRMVMAEAAPGGYKELGAFTIPDVQRHSWSHPVISGGVLYLREQDQIHAYPQRGAQGAPAR
ncbi:MAG TPA: PQQ-binding-like beta-propeller repeat protein [Candidatus Polarisedimenticolia bacterium]|nr:PQQ-binding-like beta-propeller repeat protein [Candidatus Polarisedimenticolia bacterium]